MSESPFPNTSEGSEDSEWVSISDLMSGLMIIFMSIAVLFMVQVQKQKDRFMSQQAELSESYEQTRTNLVDRIEEEFKDDLARWDAEIIRDTITVRFRNPDTLFENGQSLLKRQFKQTLSEFFPRLAYIVYAPQFRDSIVEIRIEGHTSSFWRQGATPEESYLKNMWLSQERAFNVLAHTLFLEPPGERQSWLQDRMRANGLSDSHLILNQEGVEDVERSRRVEFRIVTDAEEQMRELKTRLERMSETFKSSANDSP